jgi:hypothetical protein
MLVRSLMDEFDSGNDDAHSVLKPLFNQGESLLWVTYAPMKFDLESI